MIVSEKKRGAMAEVRINGSIHKEKRAVTVAIIRRTVLRAIQARREKTESGHLSNANFKSNACSND